LIFKVQNRKVFWIAWLEDQADLASLEAANYEPVRDYEEFLEELNIGYGD
jgi:hypothetical protein